MISSQPDHMYMILHKLEKVKDFFNPAKMVLGRDESAWGKMYRNKTNY